MRKLAFLAAVTLFANPALADCGDDPRLAELPSLLASGSLPEKPFFLMPESFIRLQPPVREALGDIVVICPKIMVKNGAPLYPTRLNVDFNTIWDALEEAINLDDWDNVKYIRNHTETGKLDPEAVFSLLVIPLLNDSDVKKLRTSISMDLSILASDANVKDPLTPLFLADIFHAFGGKANGRPTIVWSSNLTTLEEARAVGENREVKDHLFLPYSGYAIYRAKHAMSKFGINMINARDFIRQ